MKTVAVIDYGGSNLRSVAKGLEHVAQGQHQVIVSDQPEIILAADRVVFPGQGAIGDCMARLGRLDLDTVLREVLPQKPFLGICLGLQSLMAHSDEDGGNDGLDIFPGKVIRFGHDLKDKVSGDRLKIPHMGWNQVQQTHTHPLWTNIEQGSRFYFVHSFHVQPSESSIVAATADYGGVFTSAIAFENIFATQFHPEKSQQAGLTLLTNFLEWDGCC